MRESVIKNEEEENVVSFQVITGGKEPPSSDLWLDNEPIGTIFLVKEPNSLQAPVNPVLTRFVILDRTPKTTILAATFHTEPIYIHTRDFCMKYKTPHEILGIANIPQQEQENEQRDRIEPDDSGEG